MGAERWGATTVEPLLVRLTDEEKLRKSAELARHMQETAQMKITRQLELRRMSDEIKEREGAEAQLAQDLVSGTESRPVECFEQPRYGEMLVDIVRADTHEVIRTRAMQPHERQQKMPFDALPDFDDDREDPNPRAQN